MTAPVVGSAIEGRRILVTGGSGFIGRQVVRSLGALGAHVRVVDLVAHPDPDVDTVVGDIVDAGTLDAAFDGGIDGVVHLAAVTSVLKSIEQPERTFRTNVEGTHRVLEAARGAGATALAFASTNAVTGPMEAPKITEQARLRPMTPYGATKAAAEMLMSAYTQVYGLRCTYLRLTNVYGPGMQAKDSIVARLMRCVRLGNVFEVYGEGTQVRDYVHSLDVVRAVGCALTDERWSGPVVLGSGASLSVIDVVDEVRLATGRAIDVVHGAPKAGEMPAVIVDTGYAASLGWTPSYDFATGVRGVWDEWRALDLSSGVAEPLPGGAGLAGVEAAS